MALKHMPQPRASYEKETCLASGKGGVLLYFGLTKFLIDFIYPVVISMFI